MTVNDLWQKLTLKCTAFWKSLVWPFRPKSLWLTPACKANLATRSFQMTSHKTDEGRRLEGFSLCHLLFAVSISQMINLSVTKQSTLGSSCSYSSWMHTSLLTKRPLDFLQGERFWKGMQLVRGHQCKALAIMVMEALAGFGLGEKEKVLTKNSYRIWRPLANWIYILMGGSPANRLNFFSYHCF